MDEKTTNDALMEKKAKFEYLIRKETSKIRFIKEIIHLIRKESKHNPGMWFEFFYSISPLIRKGINSEEEYNELFNIISTHSDNPLIQSRINFCVMLLGGNKFYRWTISQDLLFQSDDEP